MQVQVLRDGVGTAVCACASMQLLSLTRTRKSDAAEGGFRMNRKVRGRIGSARAECERARGESVR
jgi:hypothetical protein